jgi:hypothetical protein
VDFSGLYYDMAKAFNGIVNDRLNKLFPDKNYLMQQLLEDSRGILGIFSILLSRPDLVSPDYVSLLSMFQNKMTQILDGTYITILAEFFGTEEELEALFSSLHQTVVHGKIILRKIFIDFPGVTLIVKNSLDSIITSPDDRTEMLAVVLSLGINVIVFE